MPRELFSSFFGAGFLQLSCSPLFEDLQVKMNIYENIKVTCFTVQEAFQDSTCWHHPRSPNFCGRGLVWKSRPKIKPDPTRNLSRLTSHSSPIPSECMHYLPFLEFLKSSDHSTALCALSENSYFLHLLMRESESGMSDSTMARFDSLTVWGVNDIMLMKSRVHSKWLINAAGVILIFY